MSGRQRSCQRWSPSRPYGAGVVVGMLAAIVGLGWIPPVVTLHDAGALRVFVRERVPCLRRRGNGGTAFGRGRGAAVVRTAGSRVQLFWLDIAQGVRTLQAPARFARVVAGAPVRGWLLRVGVLDWSSGTAASPQLSVRVARGGDRFGADGAPVRLPGGVRCAAAASLVSSSHWRRARPAATTSGRSWRFRWEPGSSRCNSTCCSGHHRGGVDCTFRHLRTRVITLARRTRGVISTDGAHRPARHGRVTPGADNVNECSHAVAKVQT